MMKHLILFFPMRGRFLLVLLSMLTVSQLVMAQEGYAIFDKETETLTFTTDENTPGTKKFPTTNGPNDSPRWTSVQTEVKKVVFDPSFANVRPSSCSNWFINFKNLTSITGLEFLNTENVTSMRNMFIFCRKLQSIDVSGFKTGNVTNMESMFQGCSALRSLNTTSFKTDKVTSMQYMFKECYELESLDVSGFNTENVLNMKEMFYACRKLSIIDVSNFRTEKVTNMKSMFAECNSVRTLDVSRFETSNVTNMETMFQGCRLVSCIDASNFNTENVKNMKGMFNGCYNATSINVSSFNTDRITDMSKMFNDCYALTSIDVSHFNTANVTDFSFIFSACKSLKAIDLKGFNTSNAIYLDGMFSNCSNLLYLTFGENFITSKYKLKTNPTNNFSGASRLRYLDFYASNDDDANTQALSNLDRTARRTFLTGLPLTTVVYLPHGITKKNYTVPIDARYANLVFNDAENNRLIANSYYSEDKVDIEFPRDFITNKAEYSRTMSTTYGSAILPYEFKSNENIQAYTLDEEHTETMYFVDAETIPAHTPFAFKRLDKAEFIMEDESGNFGIMVKATQTTNAEEGGTPYTNSENLNGWTTKGYYINENVENYDKTFYIAKDKFYRADGELTMYPHRVTFHGTWETEPTIGEPAKFFEIATTDDLKTEDQVIADAIEAAEVRRSVCKAEVVYDLQGFKQPELRKGLNFIRMQDGTVKKVIVK